MRLGPSFFFAVLSAIAFALVMAYLDGCYAGDPGGDGGEYPPDPPFSAHDASAG